MQKSNILHFAFWILILTVGCGYHFIGEEKAIPSHIKKIAIPLSINQTFEPGLEDVLTTALIEEFKADGRLTVVSEKEADAILHSEIVLFHAEVLSFDEKDLATVYRVLIKGDFRVEDLRDKKIIWSERELGSTLKTEYKATSDINVTRDAKDEATRKTCRDISQDIISRFFEGF